MKFGSLNIDNLCLGNDEIDKIYLGNDEIYTAPTKGYSGSITCYVKSDVNTITYITFDRLPSATTDYDAYAKDGTIYGISSFNNKKTCYVYMIVSSGSSLQFHGGLTYNNTYYEISKSNLYDSPLQIDLTANGDISLAYLNR